MLNQTTVHVLHIEDSAADAETVRRFLASGSTSFTVHLSTTLAAGLDYLKATPAVDVLLLDENLPDARPGEALPQVRAAAPKLPVVVLTGALDHDVGPERVRQGAQDFLQKSRFDSLQLQQVLRFAIARVKQVDEENHSRLREQYEREIRNLERLSGITGKKG